MTKVFFTLLFLSNFILAAEKRPADQKAPSTPPPKAKRPYFPSEVEVNEQKINRYTRVLAQKFNKKIETKIIQLLSEEQLELAVSQQNTFDVTSYLEYSFIKELDTLRENGRGSEVGAIITSIEEGRPLHRITHQHQGDTNSIENPIILGNYPNSMYMHTHPGQPEKPSLAIHTRDYFPPSPGDITKVFEVALSRSHSEDLYPCTQWLVVAHEGYYFYRIKPSILSLLEEISISELEDLGDISISEEIDDIFQMLYKREICHQRYNLYQYI